MRLTSLYIGQYKNLRDFSLSFDGGSFIDVFVGKNGTGKSNLFEALIEIFRHLVEFDRDKAACDFNYRIGFEIDGKATEIGWNSGKLTIDGKERKTIGKTPLPDNVLIYYSGHNDTVAKLVEQYEEAFRKRIKRADFDEARYFIGIGPDYKELLLAVLLMQPDSCKARQFICQKLGIDQLGLPKPGTSVRTEPVVKVIFERPEYAKGSNRTEFDIENNDEKDRYWKAEGITKDFLEKLHKCITHSPGELTVSEGYFPSDDRYILYFDITKIQQEFADISTQERFRQFDNLKTLGMLTEITVPLQLTGGVDATITHFSDGQFQSVYIYSIVELFKDRNCITLLDEPDSFLHPEWQFDFLKQVLEIADTTAKNNHVLMSSHSASTITSANEDMINLFETTNRCVSVTKRKRSDIIKSLSAGMITVTENEARLNITHLLSSTSGAVLFTEGITDELIIETAWTKLFSEKKRPFEVQNAFDRQFLRNLFSREEIRKNHPGRTMFALFDFDEAYDDWNGLKTGQDECTDPFKGLCKQLIYAHHYAMLLPIPDNADLKPQALKPDDTPWGRGSDSHIAIEHLFYGTVSDDDWFTKVPTSCGGQRIQFTGEKVKFAKEIVPTLDPACFEVFRPMFVFINSKC